VQEKIIVLPTEVRALKNLPTKVETKKLFRHLDLVVWRFVVPINYDILVNKLIPGKYLNQKGVKIELSSF